MLVRDWHETHEGASCLIGDRLHEAEEYRLVQEARRARQGQRSRSWFLVIVTCLVAYLTGQAAW